MAQGRPLSRHGRYDAFVGMPVAESETRDIYRQAGYSSPRYTSPKVAAERYDEFARVSSHRDDPVPRPQSRRGSDGSGKMSHRHMSQEDSDDSYTHSPISQPNVSPDPAYYGGENMRGCQPRPPSSSGRPPLSGRPPSSSSRIRSARRQYSEEETPQIPSEDLPEMSAIRPPSSFSKYRLLPAIGTPVPPDEEETPRKNPLYNVINTPPSSHQPQHQQEHHQQPERPFDAPPPQHFNRKSHQRNREKLRVSSAVSDISIISDISVISSRATSRSLKPQEENVVPDCVEKLDLSQLDKPSSERSRRRKTSHSSPPRTKTPVQQKLERENSADLYDGDDDDSDSAHSVLSKRENSTVTHHSIKSSAKKPVVIPSPDHPAPSEILLAVRLPTDGSRHQRYFNSNESLQAIVDFAEEVAGQDFGGYILVLGSAPKNTFENLEETIESVGLEDKTVLHLEELD